MDKRDGLLFLDTGDAQEVERYLKLGFIDGVTTNPTIMKKCGAAGGFSRIKDRSIEIAKLIHPLPLSVECASPEGRKDELLEQAHEFSKWHDNINVKIPITDQSGKPLTDVIKQLSDEGISVNATAMMSVSQCFIAAKVGAKYVSIFAGRIANMGYDPSAELSKLRQLLDRTGLPAQIIAASSREAFNVLQWWQAGAHIITVTPSLINPCLTHPYTSDTVKMFDKDAADWVFEWRDSRK